MGKFNSPEGANSQLSLQRFYTSGVRLRFPTAFAAAGPRRSSLFGMSKIFLRRVRNDLMK